MSGALIPATAAQASVTVNAPSCSSYYSNNGNLQRLDCVESSSPAGVTVTWNWWFTGQPQMHSAGTSTLLVGCLGDVTYMVDFGYTSGGVTYSSKVADVNCVPDKN